MKSSYLKRVLITAALVLVGVPAAWAPAAHATTRPVDAIPVTGYHTGSDTPWG